MLIRQPVTYQKILAFVIVTFFESQVKNSITRALIFNYKTILYQGINHKVL